MSSAKSKREERRDRVSGRRRAEEHKSGFQTKCFSVPEGKKIFMVKQEGVQKLDIIPYMVPANANNPFAEEGEMHFERTYFAHRDIGPDGDMYPCLKKTFNLACPICDYRAQLLRDPDADEKVVKGLAPKERQLWNVFDPDDESKGVQLWEYSFHLFGKQLDARVNNSDEEDGYEFFADPDDGMTLKVGFAEESFGKNTFYTASSIDFKRRDPIPNELLAKALVLDSLLIKYKYEDLKKLFLQTAETKEEDEPIREPDTRTREEVPARRERPAREDREERSSKKEESPPARESREERPARRERPAPDKEESAPVAKDRPTRERDTTTTASRSKAPEKTPAEKYGIEVNQTVDHKEFGECTVIKISSDGSAIYILDDKNGKHSVDPADVEIVIFEDDPEPEEKPKAGRGKPSSKKDETPDEQWDENWDDDKK